MSFLYEKVYPIYFFLYRYPIRYIRHHFEKTLSALGINTSTICPVIIDPNQYHFTRQELLQQPTPLQHARASRIAEQINPYQPLSHTDSLISFHFEKKKKKKSVEYPMIIHYTHEQRFKHYKFMLQKIWHDSFRKTQIASRRFMVGTRNNPNLTREFVRRRPYTPKSTSKHSKRPSIAKPKKTRNNT